MTLHLTASNGEPKPPLYCFCNSCDEWSGLHIIIAVTEDGRILGSHASTNHDYGKHDIQHPFKHEAYGRELPDGYQIIWVENAHGDERVQAINASLKARSIAAGGS
jgi:hypothetical protein